MLANYKEKTAHLLTCLILIILFFSYSLSKTKILITSVIIIFLISIITDQKNKLHFNKSDLLINSILLCFSTSYYITCWTHGYIELERGILDILLIQTLYLLGHYSYLIFKRNDNELKIIMPVIFLALGFSVYFFSATLREAITIKSFFISSRKLLNPLSSGIITATVVPIYSSIGIALIPLGLKLLRYPNKTILNIFLLLTIFSMGATGLISAFMLSNRSPFVLLILILSFSTFYLAYIKYNKKQLPWFLLLVFLLIISTAFYFLFFTDLYFLTKYNIPLLDRLSKNNLGFHRSRLWWFGINHLSTNFWGGETYALTLPFLDAPSIDFFRINVYNPLTFLQPTHYQRPYLNIYNNTSYHYIHNLWLDIHYKAGMIPFCFMITFHLMHTKSLLLILKEKRQTIAITVLCIVSTTLFYFMIEPVITAGNSFFMASFFLLGYFRQIQTNSIKHYCKT